MLEQYSVVTSDSVTGRLSSTDAKCLLTGNDMAVFWQFVAGSIPIRLAFIL